MKVADLLFLVGLRVRLVSEISTDRGMCPKGNITRVPGHPARRHMELAGNSSLSARVAPRLAFT